MKKCSQCGRLGLFFHLDADGLCERCAEKEAKRKVEEDFESAREFVKKLSYLFKDIDKSGAQIPSSRSSVSWHYTNRIPYDYIDRLHEDCRTICAELPKWGEYPCFSEAFLTGCIQEPHHLGYYSHVAIPLGEIYGNKELPVGFSERVRDLVERVNSLDSALLLYGKYEHKTYRIVGSSYDNDDGTSRQSILGKIKRGAKPFQTETKISLSKYKYQDEDAVAVYANDLQIGHISRKDLASSLLPSWDRYDSVVDFEILGKSGPYGMDIVVRFEKEH